MKKFVGKFTKNSGETRSVFQEKINRGDTAELAETQTVMTK